MLRGSRGRVERGGVTVLSGGMMMTLDCDKLRSAYFIYDFGDLLHLYSGECFSVTPFAERRFCDTYHVFIASKNESRQT